jgi:hypothetical protein
MMAGRVTGGDGDALRVRLRSLAEGAAYRVAWELEGVVVCAGVVGAVREWF